MKNEDRVKQFLETAKNWNRPIKVVVAGSRGFTDYVFFKKVMYDLFQHFPDCELVSGKAPSGPDLMAIEFAKEYGLLCHEYPAKWNDLGVPNVRIKFTLKGRQYNANAGHDRNQIMADVSDFYIVFWDGKSPGTRDMLKRLELQNKPGVLFMV